MSEINNLQKIFELSKIWKEAAYNFAFWDKVDIDWDAEYKKELERILETKDIYDYYRELSRFVTLLNDGHTSVTFPLEMYQDSEYFSILPVILSRGGNKIIVIDRTEEIEDRVPLYSVLKKIDGTDIEDYIIKNCYPYIWHGNKATSYRAALNMIMFGRAGSSALLTFEKDRNFFEVKLSRSDCSKMKWKKNKSSIKTDESQKILNTSDNHLVYLHGDTAIIKIMSFGDDSVPGKIFECYEELKKAKAYIIDVRNNGGGSSPNGDAVASLFIKDKFKSTFAETQIYEPTYKAHSFLRNNFENLSLNDMEKKFAGDSESIKTYRMGRNMYYVRDNGDDINDTSPGKLSGPVAVLMNEYTASAAEDFIDVMKMYTKAVFIGNNTAGSSGQPINENLESGGSFRICTRRCIAQNGEDIYNKGFAPDVRVIQTFEDFVAGRDTVMEKALELLKKK